MGDLVELHTPQKHQNLFYRITNNALIFYVKGEANASLGLAQGPTPDDCIYWIVLGHRNSCFILNKGCSYKQKVIYNLLSNSKYRRFWISWNDGFIKLGRGHMQTPILSQKNTVPDLHFVTFSVLNEELDYNVISWKFSMPPQSITLRSAIKKIKGGKTHWEKYIYGSLPKDAIIGGYENETLYIMRAFHEGALTPGKFVPSAGKGYVAWGDRAHEKSDLEIFCGYDCIWIPSSRNNIPVGAIEAGFSQVVNERMYVGRVQYAGHLIPGKVEPSHNVCYIPYNGKTVAVQDYEILIDPSKENMSVNEFYIPDLKNIFDY